MSTAFASIPDRSNSERIFASWFNALRDAGASVEAGFSAGTPLNTPNTIVVRGASGEFAAGAITGTSFTGAVTGSTGSFSGVLTSTVTTGTAPLVVSSTTFVANLYVARSALSDTVTTNANMTGPITTSGNVTSVTAQTGSGSTFVMNTSPTLITPELGVATATSLTLSGQLVSSLASGTAPFSVTSDTMVSNLYAQRASLADTVTTNANLTGDVTSVGNATTIPAGSIEFAQLVGTDITAVGTIGAGTWQGTAVAIGFGGTGQTTKAPAFDALSPMSASGDLIYGGTAGTGTRLPKATDGDILKLVAGLPAWSTPSATGVTSVDVSVPSFLTSSGGPITSSGTIALSYSGTALPLANGGTGQTTKAPAFDALSPMTTSGDIIYGGTSGTGTRLAKGSDGQVLTLASGIPSWAAGGAAGVDQGGTYNLGLATSVSANALTISLKQADGSSDPASGSGMVSMNFRNATSTNGGYVQRNVTSSLTVVVPSGGTLGTANSDTYYGWVYAIDNGGTVELGVSLTLFDDGTIKSTTAVASATTNSAIFTQTGRTNVAIRVIGRFTFSQTTAGTWATAPTEVTRITPAVIKKGAPIAVIYRQSSGQSFTTATYTTVTWDVKEKDTHNAMSSGTFTAPRDDYYTIHGNISFTANGNNYRSIEAWKNGAVKSILHSYTGDANISRTGGSGTEVFLAAGDTLVLKAYQTSGGALTLVASPEFNSISITTK